MYYADAARPDGSLGVATLRNRLPVSLYLPGCSQYALERRDDAGNWLYHGPPIYCVWEGYAQKVAPGAEVAFPFNAPPDSGTWRIRFRVSIGCQDGKPLSQAACESSATIHTPPFVVHASRGDGQTDGAAGAIEFGVNRPGGDYARFDVDTDDPRVCQFACQSAALCTAWTFVMPGYQGPSARCLLKSQVPAAVPDTCCVSGVKGASTGPAENPDAEDPDKTACEAAGGTWRRGGLSPEPLCFYPMPDASKPCDRKSQCRGQCLVVEPGRRVGGMPGRCAEVAPIFGCFDFLDEGGRQRGICVD